jgi:hypothetical protein
VASDSPQGTEQEKLHVAFANRKIKLRLNGSRLPPNYVVNLRLTKKEDAEGRSKASRTGTPRKRRTRAAVSTSRNTSSESEGDIEEDDLVPGPQPQKVLFEEEEKALSAVERELREIEDEEVRRTNAYPGATNTIGSVHQRKWYVSLDREACGFAEKRAMGRTIWEVADDAKASNDAVKTGRLEFPFHVHGPEHERSVVTGRLGGEILRDERVTGFVRRQGWKPVLN